MNLTPPQVLHVDLVLTREDLSVEARGALLEEATALRQLPGVVEIGLIKSAGSSDFDLAFFFVLRDLPHLEAFGTNERYVRFLQGALARSLRSFAGADVQLDAPFAGAGGHAACLALIAPPQTYDWQVREALTAWATAGKRPLAGLAVGERQRYRGVGIMFSSSPIRRPPSGLEGFGVDFVSGRCHLLS